MDSFFYITFITLLTFPIISLELIRRSKHRPGLRKVILKCAAISSALILFGLITTISSTSDTADLILCSCLFLGFCLFIWWAAFAKQILIKTIGSIVPVLVFGLVYLSCTIGILGLGLVMADFVPNQELALKDGLSLKTYKLGNAISDSRHVRVEVFKSIGWLPVEWRLKKKMYYDIMLDGDLTCRFDATSQTLFLSGADVYNREKIRWADTLYLKR